jgi:hypothetical protein
LPKYAEPETSRVWVPMRANGYDARSARQTAPGRIGGTANDDGPQSAIAQGERARTTRARGD